MTTAAINHSGAWRWTRDRITHHGMREERAAVIRVLCQMAEYAKLVDGRWVVEVTSTVRRIRERVQRMLKRTTLAPATFRSWMRWLCNKAGLSLSRFRRGNTQRQWCIVVDRRAVGEVIEVEADPVENVREMGKRQSDRHEKALAVFEAYPKKRRWFRRDALDRIHREAHAIEQGGDVEGCPYEYLRGRAEAYAGSEDATKDGGRWAKRIDRWLLEKAYADDWAQAPKVTTGDEQMERINAARVARGLKPYGKDGA